MAPTLPILVGFLFGLAAAQTPGKTPEVHPKLQTWKCTKRGGCVAQNSAVVLDDLSHNVHQLNDASLGCGNWGSAPNVTVCPDEKTCAKNCIVEGISDYAAAGITTNGSALHMSMFNSAGTDVSPRAYLLEQNGAEYELLKLTGNELSFDVDVSKLPCGMNGALYLTEMSQTGGRSALNPGGATYGTGYCDAQCYTYPFVNGVVSIPSKLRQPLTKPGQHRRERSMLQRNGHLGSQRIRNSTYSTHLQHNRSVRMHRRGVHLEWRLRPVGLRMEPLLRRRNRVLRPRPHGRLLQTHDRRHAIPCFSQRHPQSYQPTVRPEGEDHP